ncbi:MAG: IS21 family transposase [Verrucomicrobiae bacterium]|nr:IS21 family transposase [Verrucomicrobiae bacterium]
MNELQEFVRLHRLGLGPRKVAKRLGISPNTERKYREPLAAAGVLTGDPNALPELEALNVIVTAAFGEQQPGTCPSSIEAWRERITTLLEGGAGPTAIHERLSREPEFDGSIGSVKRMCRQISKAKGIRAEDVAIPVETAAGEVAQVDFGYVGQLYDPDEGRMRKAWVFVMVLAYSRLIVARIVFDQTITTWLRCHAEAFVELGGVLRVLVPDNLKAAVIRASFGVDGLTVLNRSYREFARFFGFQIDPTPAYSPEKKGKVEAAVKYIKNNFFAARRDINDVVELRAELQSWLRDTANVRVHGTTRQRPAEVFAIERDHLLPLPEQRWEPVQWREAKVHVDSHVQVGRALYSVPWRLVGREILARITEHSVELYANDTRVATHERQPPGRRSTIEAHLPEGRRDLRHRCRDHWEEKADELDPEIGAYIREVFAADEVLSQLRTVQAIVRHLGSFPIERARAACRRASFYGLYSYSGIKNILTKGLDMEPLPIAIQRPSGALESPRFARKIGELLQLPLENIDAPN